MLKRRIKILGLIGVLVCMLPVNSYGLDKEDFLRFLINSSYPESNLNDEKTNAQDEDVKEEKETSNENSNEQDYIKVHVGKENIPKIEDKKENTEESEEVASVSSQYKNNIRITKENPSILLYHTHAAETYSNSPAGNYHSDDRPNSVLRVGEIITEELSQKGWGVVHTTEYHDYPEYNGAYTRSLATLKELLGKHKSVDIAIDIHRDARDLKSSEDVKKEEERMTTTIDGEKVAKFFFVVGPDNPNIDQVMKLANNVTNFAKKKYPGLVEPVIVKDYGKFNQYLAKNHMLIEIGSNGTTTEEAERSAKYVAQILDEYFNDYR